MHTFILTIKADELPALQRAVSDSPDIEIEAKEPAPGMPEHLQLTLSYDPMFPGEIFHLGVDFKNYLTLRKREMDLTPSSN